MEPRGTVKIVVGLFVLAGILLFGMSVFLLGERGRYFAPQHPLKAFFTNVAGLHEGATVRLAGVTVGRVTRIRLPEPPERKVLVELAVAGDAIQNVRRDSVARIETMGFLGDKYVEIGVGSPGEPPVSGGATLAVGEPGGVVGLAGQGQRVLERAERIATSLEGMLATFETARTAEAIAGTARTVERLASALEREEGALPWLITNPEGKRLVAETIDSIRSTAASLENGEGALPWLIRDRESRKLVEDLRQATDSLAAISKQVRDGQGLAHALIYDREGGKMLEDASRALRDLRSLLQDIREGDGAIPALLFDPRSRQLVENLTETSRHLKEISAKIARGEGTLGALLADPTLYDELTSLLEGAKRSWILRTLIRSTLESGRDARRDTRTDGARRK